MGELLRQMRQSGERRPQGNEVKSRGATSLKDLGFRKHDGSRAMQRQLAIG